MKTYSRQRPHADQQQNKLDALEEIPEDTRSKEEILQSCRKAIWARLDRITKALIVQTLNKGSYLHARFLFDLVGFAHGEEREPREDESLVKLLLEKLDAPEVVGAAIDPDQNCSCDPDRCCDACALDTLNDQSLSVEQSSEPHTVE